MSNPPVLIKDWSEVCRYYFPTSTLASAPNPHIPTLCALAVAYAITRMRVEPLRARRA